MWSEYLNFFDIFRTFSNIFGRVWTFRPSDVSVFTTFLFFFEPYVTLPGSNNQKLDSQAVPNRQHSTEYARGRIFGHKKQVPKTIQEFSLDLFHVSSHRNYANTKETVVHSGWQQQHSV